ncbi:hypothetical protein D3C80_18710 [compost metagenome]
MPGLLQNGDLLGLGVGGGKQQQEDVVLKPGDQVREVDASAFIRVISEVVNGLVGCDDGHWSEQLNTGFDHIEFVARNHQAHIISEDGTVGVVEADQAIADLVREERRIEVVFCDDFVGWDHDEFLWGGHLNENESS